MNKWKHCAAKTRPTHCFYEDTNLCCFNCDRNVECTKINWDNEQKVIPCMLNMKIQTVSGTVEELVLFDETERCEFAI